MPVKPEDPRIPPPPTPVFGWVNDWINLMLICVLSGYFVLIICPTVDICLIKLQVHTGEWFTVINPNPCMNITSVFVRQHVGSHVYDLVLKTLVWVSTNQVSSLHWYTARFLLTVRPHSCVSLSHWSLFSNYTVFLTKVGATPNLNALPSTFMATKICHLVS